VLDSPVHPANGFASLPAVGRLDSYAARKKQDARFTISGYGLSDQDPVVVSFRKRLQAESYLVNNEAPLTEFNLKTTANPRRARAARATGTPVARCSSRGRT